MEIGIAIFISLAFCAGALVGAVLMRGKVYDMIEVLIVRGRQHCIEDDFQKAAMEARAVRVLKELKEMLRI